MKSEHPNIQLLLKVARSIGPLLEKVVFVGGATTTLHMTDSSQVNQARPTIDVDMIIDANKASKFQQAEKVLRNHGFQPDPDLICRYRKKELIIDLLPTHENILGFSNRWYKEGIKHASVIKIEELEIHHLSFPYFMATKLEAFEGRGKGDFYGSKDMEDIVTVLVGRNGFLRDLSEIADPLKSYIQEQFSNHIQSEDFINSVSGHIPRCDNLEVIAASLIDDIRTFIEMG